MSATRSFRLGYSIITWGGTPDLDQALGAIAGASWEGAEFTSTSLEWLGTPRHLRAVFDRYELPLVCIFGGVNLANDPVHIERQRRRIEFAGEMGCEVFCLLGASRVHQRLPTDDEFKRLADQAETFIDHAEPYGLQVAYHAHPRTEVVALCDLVTERLEALGEEIGVNARFGDLDEMIRQTQPDIVAIPTGTEFHYETGSAGAGAWRPY